MNDCLTIIAPNKQQYILQGVKKAAQNPEMFAQWATSNKLPPHPVVGVILRAVFAKNKIMTQGERRTAVCEGWTAILQG